MPLCQAFVSAPRVQGEGSVWQYFLRSGRKRLVSSCNVSEKRREEKRREEKRREEKRRDCNVTGHENDIVV